MGWGAISGSLAPLHDLLKRGKPLSTLNAYPPQKESLDKPIKTCVQYQYRLSLKGEICHIN